MAEIAYTLHDLARDYPERSVDSPLRIRRALRVLRRQGIPRALGSRPASTEELGRVHAAAHIQGLADLAESGGAWLDPELYLDQPLHQAAVNAAGTLSAAALDLLKRPQRLLLALSRPGSHHAGPDYSLGFCVFNNLAVAAASARSAGCSRVAILDWDAHHGNGTQEIFWCDPTVLTISMHQHPFFPGSGAGDERGGDEGLGYNLNIPLAAGSDGAQAVSCWYEQALPLLREFGPELIIVEAGLDAHHSDWTSGLCFDAESFQALARETAAAAREIGAPLLLELGGGYVEQAIAEGLPAMLEGLRQGAGDG